MSDSRILLGTSSFTAPGWVGSFYPAHTRPSDFLRFYAERFDTVEIDSTFYRSPTPETVKGWVEKTPAEFVFSLKVPQIITHEKVLLDCQPEFELFVNTVDILQEKLGPMVLQFPYFNRAVMTREQFVSRLKLFLTKLPKHEYKFAIEIRNKEWLDAEFADLLREHGVALVLQDQSWMPHPNELAAKFDPITADFTYVRWLGDRTKMEAITTSWDRVVQDRKIQLSGWVDVVSAAFKRGVSVYAYANNHYEGYAPATIENFRRLWCVSGLPDLRPRRTRQESSLFDTGAK